jgi:hypothetical protein
VQRGREGSLRWEEGVQNTAARLVSNSNSARCRSGWRSEPCPVGGEEEQTGIQADSLIFGVARDRNQFKSKKGKLLDKVSHFLIQGSTAFCNFS